MAIGTVCISPNFWERLGITENQLNKAVRVALPILLALGCATAAYALSPSIVTLSVGATLLATAIIACQLFRYQFAIVLTPEDFIAKLQAGEKFENHPIFVTGDVVIIGDKTISSMPTNLTIQGNLELRRNSELTSLPEGLSVKGNFYLNASGLMRCLPSRMSIGGDFDLHGSHILDTLPADLSVGGDLDLQGWTGLETLPKEIMNLGPKADWSTRHVRLERCNLSDVKIDELRKMPAPGMQFHFSRAQPVKVDWKTMEDAYEAWGYPTRPTIPLTPIETRQMVYFLSRLQKTAEYTNEDTLRIFSLRTLRVLQRMEADEEYRKTVIDTLSHRVGDCPNQTILDFNTLYRMNLVDEAEKRGRVGLGMLGYSLLMLEKVNEQARLHMKTLPWCYDSAVLLAFQIGLREQLRLPLSTTQMDFRDCADVSDEQIQAVGDAILREYTQEALDKFLAEWEPWKKMLQQEASQQ